MASQEISDNYSKDFHKKIQFEINLYEDYKRFFNTKHQKTIEEEFKALSNVINDKQFFKNVHKVRHIIFNICSEEIRIFGFGDGCLNNIDLFIRKIELKNYMNTIQHLI